MGEMIADENPDYFVSTEPGKLDLDRIHALLSSSYWAKDIPRTTVEKSIEHSLAFAVVGEEGLVGFARVITDYSTFAYLADVIIAPECRGKGLGQLLVGSIMKDPRLQNLRRWMLVTRDGQKLYEKFGFSEVSHPERFMECLIKDPYAN